MYHVRRHTHDAVRAHTITPSHLACIPERASMALLVRNDGVQPHHGAHAKDGSSASREPHGEAVAKGVPGGHRARRSRGRRWFNLARAPAGLTGWRCRRRVHAILLLLLLLLPWCCCCCDGRRWCFHLMSAPVLVPSPFAPGLLVGVVDVACCSRRVSVAVGCMNKVLFVAGQTCVFADSRVRSRRMGTRASTAIFSPRIRPK